MTATTERRWRALFAAWAAAVTVLSVLPPAEMPPTFGIADIFQHGLAYAAGGVCALMAWSRLRAGALAALGAIALGGTLEIVQLFLIPGRNGEWHDFAADAIGVAAGAGAIAVWRQLRRGRFTEP